MTDPKNTRVTMGLLWQNQPESQVFGAGKYIVVWIISETINTSYYTVIQNDCQGFNNLSYTIHLR